MADILIRVEMPRNCFECPLFTNCDACEGHECGCGLLGGIGYEEDISEDRRRDDCPLVELPEHGDLIDRSKLSFICAGTTSRGMDYVRRYVVDGMTVIIPSNKEETE